MLAAQQAALEKVRPGATFREAEEAARAALGCTGTADLLPTGSRIMSAWLCTTSGRAPLEPGVVIAVEPGCT